MSIRGGAGRAAHPVGPFQEHWLTLGPLQHSKTSAEGWALGFSVLGDKLIPASSLQAFSRSRFPLAPSLGIPSQMSTCSQYPSWGTAFSWAAFHL